MTTTRARIPLFYSAFSRPIYSRSPGMGTTLLRHRPVSVSARPAPALPRRCSSSPAARRPTPPSLPPCSATIRGRWRPRPDTSPCTRPAPWNTPDTRCSPFPPTRARCGPMTFAPTLRTTMPTAPTTTWCFRDWCTFRSPRSTVRSTLYLSCGRPGPCATSTSCRCLWTAPVWATAS